MHRSLCSKASAAQVAAPAHPSESMTHSVPWSLKASHVSVAPGDSGSAPRCTSVRKVTSHTAYCSACGSRRGMAHEPPRIALLIGACPPSCALLYRIDSNPTTKPAPAFIVKLYCSSRCQPSSSKSVCHLRNNNWYLVTGSGGRAGVPHDRQQLVRRCKRHHLPLQRQRARLQACGTHTAFSA